MEPEKFTRKTEEEVNAWKIAGWTAPFVAMAGFILCGLFFNDLLPFYAVSVIVVWVAISVAWWWWAVHKILRIARLMLDTTKNFQDVKTEIEEFKKDVGNRKRGKQE